MSNWGKDAFDTATHTAIRKAVWRIDLSKYWFFLICGVAAVPVGIYSFTVYFFKMLMRSWGMMQ